jgi:hypothetical protein
MLLSQKWETRVKNENAMVFFLLFFSVSLRLIVPLTDGTLTFVAFRDPIYNFQLTTIYSEYGHWVWGLETGQALEVLFTPMLHLFSVSTSMITGIDLYNICRFIPPIIFTLITMLLFFCTFRRLIGFQKALLACFIFAICYKYNTFTSLYLPESLGIVFFAMALYGLVSMKSERGSSGRRYSIIFIIASSLLVTTHFFSSFIFLVAIAVGLMVSKMFRSSDVSKSSIKATNFLVFATVMYAWIFFIASHLFVVNTNYVTKYLNQLFAIIQSPWEPRSIQGVQEAGLSLWESIVAYSGILIPILFGLLTCFALFIRKRRSANHYTYWRRVFAATSLVLTAVTAVGLFAIVESHDVAYRFVTFMYVFLAPTAAVSLGAIQGPEEHTRASTTHSIRLAGRSWIHGIFVMLILIVPVLSTGLLLPSFVGEHIMFDDREIVVASKWFSSYVNKSATVVGELTLGDPITALARVGFWGEVESAQFNHLTMIDAIYYVENTSYITDFFQQQKAATLLILDKHFIDHNHFLLHASTRTRVPSVDAMNSTFQALDQSPSLNKIYEGEAPSIYIASTGK